MVSIISSIRRVAPGSRLAVGSSRNNTCGRNAQTRASARLEACSVDAQTSKLEGVWDEEVRAQVKQAFEATGLGFVDTTLASVEARLDERATRWAEQRTEACRLRVHGETPALANRRIACLSRRRTELAGTGWGSCS